MFSQSVKMQRLLFNHTRDLENALMVIACFFAVVIVRILVLDIPIITKNSFGTTSGETIAKLSTAENIVRRKTGDLPVWNTAKSADTLYLGDEIFTDENSTAQIDFIDEPTIKLAQNTMVVVRKSEHKNILQLTHGTLSVKFAKPGTFVLDVGGKQSKITAGNDTKIQITATGKNGSTVAALKGEVKLTSGGGEVALKADQYVEMKSDSPTDVRNRALSLMEPQDGLEVTSEKTDGMAFNWQAQGAEHVFELATDQSFQHVVIQRTETAPATSISHLPPHVYYWRVRSLGEVSETRTLIVKDPKPAELIAPFPGEIIALNGQTTTVYFDWQHSHQADNEVFELSQDSDFATKETQSRVKPPLLSRPLTVGAYFWRVCTLQPEHSPICSAASQFKVGSEGIQEQPANESAPEAPKLKKQYRIKPSGAKIPEQGMLMKLLDSLFVSTAYAAETEEQAISWDEVAGASGYEAQLAKDAAFKDVVLEKVTTQPVLSIHGLAPGPYYLRVRSINRNGTKSPYSEASTVYLEYPGLKLLSPSDGQEVEKKSDTVPVEFAWEKIPGVESYIFELYSDKDSKTPIAKIKVTGTKTTRTFTRNSTFYWRVGVELRVSEADFSPRQKIVITEEKLSAPKLQAGVLLKKTTPASPLSAVCPIVPASQLTCPAVEPAAQVKQLADIPASLEEKSVIYLIYGPTRVDVANTYASSREVLQVTAVKTAKLNLDLWFGKLIGAEVNYEFLRANVFGGSTSASTQQMNLSNLHAVVKNKWILRPATHAYGRLGYFSGSLPQVKWSTQKTPSLNIRKVNGPSVGLAVGHTLASNWQLGLKWDQIIPVGSTTPVPLHALFKTQILMSLASHLSLGPEYSLEYAKYKFKDDSQSNETSLMQKQSLGVVLGWSF